VRKGFTLTEVVVVIGIILVLSAIGFSLSAPLRIKALESKSASQMKTIYQGVMLYSADTGSFDEIPGTGQIPLGFGASPYVILPYGVRHEDFFSPVTPIEQHRHYVSTFYLPYTNLAIAYLRGNREDQLAESLLTLKKEGDAFPILMDWNFDAIFYWPREQDQDPYMQRVHEIRLMLNGAVKVHRVPGKRRIDHFTKK
jgi:prepilin-type N-terminal cleavage/methylation domain-containing protein